MKFITLAHVVYLWIDDHVDDNDGEQYDCYCF